MYADQYRRKLKDGLKIKRKARDARLDKCVDDEACGRVRQHVGMHVLCGSLLKLWLQHRLVAILGLISRPLGLPRIRVSCLVLSGVLD